MKERDTEREPWDKKKIVLACLFLLGVALLFFTLKSVLLDDGGTTKKDTRGIKTEKLTTQDAFEGVETPQFSIDLEEKGGLIKEDLDSVDVEEIASSSPQIQKILNDIKTLKDLPSSTARQTCENLCKNF